MNVKSWISQPSTIKGLGAAAATIAGLITHVITKDITAAAGAAGAAYSLVHVVLPDNTAAASSVEKLVTDAVTAAAQKKLAAALPLLIQDGMAVVSAMTVPVTVTPVVVSNPTTSQLQNIAQQQSPSNQGVAAMPAQYTQPAAPVAA